MKPYKKEGSIFTLHYSGLSRDGRTNKWKVECNCGYVNEPPTCMSSHQCVVCERCNHEEIVNYNEALDQ